MASDKSALRSPPSRAPRITPRPTRCPPPPAATPDAEALAAELGCSPEEATARAIKLMRAYVHLLKLT